MRRLLLLIVAASASAYILAQDEDPKGLTAASKAYRAYRMYQSSPRYGLAKVKRLVAKIEKLDADSEVMAPKVFNALPAGEKFTYCMLHAEIFDQNCDAMPGILGEEKKMFAFPIEPFYGQTKWSPQQEGFLHKHRAQVIGFIRSTFEANHRVGCNLKAAIIDLNAKELIPALVSVYNRDHKDQDILSTLCVLMKNAKYGPFLKSGIYKELYGNPDTSYKAFVTVTPTNQRLLVHWAMAYNRSR